MKKIFYLHLFIGICFYLNSYSQNQNSLNNEINSQDESCSKMKQLSQLAFCLSSKDPEWKEMTYQLEASKYKLEIANELPNPEFAWKFGYGSFLGDKIWQNELSVSQTIPVTKQ